jgi:hypothetical protein
VGEGVGELFVEVVFWQGRFYVLLEKIEILDGNLGAGLHLKVRRAL